LEQELKEGLVGLRDYFFWRIRQGKRVPGFSLAYLDWLFPGAYFFNSLFGTYTEVFGRLKRFGDLLTFPGQVSLKKNFL